MASGKNLDVTQKVSFKGCDFSGEKAGEIIEHLKVIENGHFICNPSSDIIINSPRIKTVHRDLIIKELYAAHRILDALGIIKFK